MVTTWIGRSPVPGFIVRWIVMPLQGPSVTIDARTLALFAGLERRHLAVVPEVDIEMETDEPLRGVVALVQTLDDELGPMHFYPVPLTPRAEA